MTDLHDAGGVILSIGDQVCLVDEITKVHPGPVIGTVVRFRFDEKEKDSVEVLCRFRASDLKRLNTLIGAATEALSQDMLAIKEMRSGEVPIRKEPE